MWMCGPCAGGMEGCKAWSCSEDRPGNSKSEADRGRIHCFVVECLSSRLPIVAACLFCSLFPPHMPWLSSRLSDRTSRFHGAVVVRTPDDALKDTNVRVDFGPQSVRDALKDTNVFEPQSVRGAHPPKPHRPAPASLSAPSTPVDHPPIPPDPSLTLLSAPAPSFSPILLSPPGSVSHLSNAIVVLETCTTTYKSTLTTLCSQPSFLADYLNSLAKPRISASSSIYSSESTDLDGNHRPVSQGRSTSCSASFHIFLDRSSPP